MASTTSSRETSELSPSLTPLRVPQRPIRSMRTHTILEISKFSGSLDSVELTFQCVGTAWNFALSTVVIVVTIDQEPFPHDVKSLRPPEFSVPLLLNRQGCFISNSSWSLNDSWSGGFPRSPIMLIEDSESNIYMSFVPVWKDGFYFQRGIFQVLPDLHGGGANQTSLRYEDVIQQVKFSTTD